MELYFSQHFQVDPEILREYGAFDISVVTDLPMFVDPFLLFNSAEPTYQALHEEIIRYLLFLRDHATADLEPGLVEAWYCFKEVKQNWLGFTLFGNEGHGLGSKFAKALHGTLGKILASFGDEQVTRGSHLEKLCLLQPGVGRDNISDFTTNLIKHFFCEYTETFARQHVRPTQSADVMVPRASFNYGTETWETRKYCLPVRNHDFVLLTPADLLTRDDTWINYRHMVSKIAYLPTALPDPQLRAQVDHYLRKALGKQPTAAERREAVGRTIRAFPQLIDQYIRMQEDAGDAAVAISEKHVTDTRRVLVDQVKQVLRWLERNTDFYQRPWTSFDEALGRIMLFKDYVEHQDGYKLLNKEGKPFSNEEDVQLFFGLVWCGSEFDLNREPNNGRGPVDFKASYGAGDKSLIEFKLASNSRLKQNLQKQVAIYEKANRTCSSIKVIVCYRASEQEKVSRVLRELRLEGDKSIVVIDARSDNKPSASKA